MSKNSSIQIIGHRGAAGLAFENTLESILKAVEFKVDWVEIDVWKTIDGEIIVFHDSYLERLCNQKGFTAEINYKENKDIRLKNGTVIPTLKKIVRLAKERQIKLLVEVKSEDAFVGTLNILKEELPVGDYIIGSFIHSGVQKIKKHEQEIPTAIMFESVPVLLDQYLTLINCDYVIVSIETYNHYLIETIKSQDRKLVFYTVNTPPEIELALRNNPDAIITNFPNLFNRKP